MMINELELKNFRKFEDYGLEFKPGINLITGPNGSGKSTLLHAIYFAIYGEVAGGTNLRDYLYYGKTGRANIAQVCLKLTNSSDMSLKREIRLVENVASQKTFFNGELASTSKLEDIEKNFPQKEIFSKIAFIDNFRQDLSDINQQSFRQILLGEILPWNMQKVLDNTKSMSVYLQSKEQAFSRVLADDEKEIQDFEKMEILIKSLIQEKKELSQKVENIHKIRNELEKKRASQEIREGDVFYYIDVMEKTVNQIKNIGNRLERNQRMYEDFTPPKNNSIIARYISDYIDKIRVIQIEFAEIRDLFNKINAAKIDLEHQRKMLEKEISMKILIENKKLHNSIARLEALETQILSMKNHLSAKQRIKDAIEKRKTDLENYRKDSIIAEKIRELIISLNKKSDYSFFKKIENRMNKQLEDLKIDAALEFNEKDVSAIIRGIKTDIDLLSAGELGLFNVLTRIAILQELGYNSFLLLEDPIAHFDWSRKKIFLSVLKALKENFSQIIFTTHRNDLGIDADNFIRLE